MDLDIVDLSRLQFAITALYHFLFVPLTLGLAVLLAIMETVYVMTGRVIWRQMTKFWGTLFGINFAIGVATGLVMEFQFGMNWSYYSHYVGDVFGAPLAIEGLMAFFLEATFVGLFFFGWDRLSKIGHLTATWAVALGSNLSALWILIANGWMQNPVGSAFNPQTMRMEVTDFFAVLFNPVAQAKFVHTVSAGYVTASIFVLGVSAWYLLKGRHIALAKRSMTVAASFGLAASLSVVVLGDESGYLSTEHQKMKLAAIEGMWKTEPAPAAFTAFGFPDQEARVDPRAGEGALPTFVGGRVEQQRIVRRRVEPAMPRHLAVELARSPAGIAQRDQPARRPPAFRDRAQRIQRRRQGPAPGDVDRVHPAPVAAVQHEAAPRLHRAAAMDRNVGRGAGIDIHLPQHVVERQPVERRADIDPHRAFRVMRADRDHRLIEARIADSRHRQQELAGKKGRGLHSAQHSRRAPRRPRLKIPPVLAT